MLGWAVFALGVGVLLAHAASVALPVETSSDASRVVFWVALLAPAVFALRRSRPRGLLRIRLVDLAYGIVFGLVVRGTQGVLAGLEGAVAWPSTFTTGDGLPSSFLTDAVGDVIVAPLCEEIFFRGVVLLCIFAVVKRWSGPLAAGVAAVALSTALFVVTHQILGALDAVDLAALALLGVVTGVFVVSTGRIWPAVAVHIVFNASGIALVAIGTLLA